MTCPGIVSTSKIRILKFDPAWEVVEEGQFRGGNGAGILFAGLALIRVLSNHNGNGSTLRSEVLERGGFDALA
jgi:hypothetical protein